MKKEALQKGPPGGAGPRLPPNHAQFAITTDSTEDADTELEGN